MKFAWIDTQCRHYPLSALCEVLGVSVNGYRAWKRGGTPERQRLTDAQLLTLIRTIHAKVKGAYGSPRMTDEVRSRGFPASKARVERLMSANGIRARHKRRYRVTTDSRHKLPVAPNVLNRQFTPAEPNQVFTSDITYIWTDEGWLYLAVTLDLFNREIVGWSVKPRMTAELVTDALTMAWFRHRPAPGALHHSDRGSQPQSSSFIARLHVANSVHARLACGSADNGYGCITPVLWKAKNRGKLRKPWNGAAQENLLARSPLLPGDDH